MAIQSYAQWYYYLANHDWIWTTCLGYTNGPGCYHNPGNSELPVIATISSFDIIEGIIDADKFQLAWAHELVYCVSIWPAKAALLFQYQRFFAPIKTGAIYIIIQILIWVNLAFYFTQFFGILFQCTPFAKIWQPSTNGTCINRFVMTLSSVIFNLVSDVLIFVLPIWAIWRLRLDLHRELGVSAIFLTGLV